MDSHKTKPCSSHSCEVWKSKKRLTPAHMYRSEYTFDVVWVLSRLTQSQMKDIKQPRGLPQMKYEFVNRKETKAVENLEDITAWFTHFGDLRIWHLNCGPHHNYNWTGYKSLCTTQARPSNINIYNPANGLHMDWTWKAVGTFCVTRLADEL